jgi:hypothetical protein
MKKRNSMQWTVVVASVVLLGGLALGGQALSGRTTLQTSPERTLVVNWKSVSGALADMQGRTYVDLQVISQALGATLTIDADRITLVTASSVAGAGGAASGPRSSQQLVAMPPPGGEHLSVNFRAAAISALGEMRQWQGAVESVISTGVPVVGSWPQDYRDQAESGINQAKVFVLTDEDLSALRLIENDFANLRDWSETVVAERKNLNAARFVDPEALKKDTVLTKITTCSRFLGGMITGGVYSDNANCH